MKSVRQANLGDGFPAPVSFLIPATFRMGLKRILLNELLRGNHDDMVWGIINYSRAVKICFYIISPGINSSGDLVSH